MKTGLLTASVTLAVGLLIGCAAGAAREHETMTNKLVKTDDEWRGQLSAGQFCVLREKGTEPPFTGKYHDFKGHGVYKCAGCGQVLFRSGSKFDSGTGWPSYWEPASTNSIETKTDTSHGMVRTEILCSRCGGHLGHVFEDGPPPTGLRYCINSAALVFEAEE